MAITNIQRNYNEDEELYISAQMDGVPFNNITGVDKSEGGVFPIGQPISRNNSIWVNPSKPWLKSVNAVDIDWNGAKPGIGEGANGINTTGELLSLLKNYAASKESINWEDVDLSYIGLDIDDNITKLESISDLVNLLAIVYNSTQQNKYDVEVENVSGNNVLIFK